MKILFVCLILISATLQAEDSLVFKSTDQRTSLIELYTSEGCSSCPPADAWLRNFKSDPRLWRQVIPIAFHVDYWDYIGWKDPFATRANTLRQNQHQQQNNISTVYTPGFVVDGREWRGFFDQKPISFIGKPEAGILKAEINDNAVEISYSAAHEILNFHIVILGFDMQTSVTRGENKGRVLQHDFVALSHQVISSVTNRLELAMPNMRELREQNKGIVIWVSRKNSLKPLQAVGGRLKP